MHDPKYNTGEKEFYMNYLNKYLDFYQGPNRKAIYKLFCEFIEALRTDNMEALSGLLTEDCAADISMVGKVQGRDACLKALAWPGPQMDIRKIMFWGFLSRSHNGIAQQYSHIQAIFAQDDGVDVYPFVFGGQFCMSYRIEDELWKISHIRFDLVYESGNNVFVKDKWKLIDYNIYFGHDPMINSYFDAPWVVIPEDDEPQSDEELVLESSWVAAHGMDTGAFDYSIRYISNDNQMDMGARNTASKSGNVDTSYSGPRSQIDWQKGKFHKEPHLQHAMSFGDLIVNGNWAKGWTFRSEWNRLYHKIYTRENIHSMAVTAGSIGTNQKEDGIWKAASGKFIPIVEFVPVDDDCLQFDEYICGGRKWSEIIKG
jgi:hypothetical protein